MVIRDIDALELKKANGPSSEGHGAIASPTDRMAAAVIDYFILMMPVIYLVMAPFQRAIKQAALFEDQWTMSMSTGLGAVAVVILILGYQSLCIWLWQGTPGKLLLGLRVRHLGVAEKIKFSDAFTRAVYWSLSVLLLGVPFLAIFSNFMRRPLHDRVADTIVISTRARRFAKAPSFHESALVRGVYWAIASFFVIGVMYLLTSMLSTYKKQTDLISSLEDQEVLCQAVSEAQNEWPLEKGKEADRLSVAMSLFAAGTIDQKCLEAEVENLYTADAESPLLYLTKSFVYADKPELSDRYLEKVCELDQKSDACILSQAVQSVADKEWGSVAESFADLRQNSSAFTAIWAIRQFVKHGEYKSAAEFLDALPDVHALADFAVPMKAKILWGLHNKEEASGAEQAAYYSVSDEAKFDLASFMCFEKIWANCEELKSQSCQTFSRMATVSADSLGNLKSSLAFLRKWECEQRGKKDYESLLSLPLHDDVKSLISALSANDTDGFNELIEGASNDGEFSSEVSRRLVERTRSQGLLKVLAEEWSKGSPTLAWEKVGEELFHKFYELKEYGESLKVGERLVNVPHLDKNLFEEVVVAAVKSGQEDRARRYFFKYAEVHPLPSFAEDRTPASENKKDRSEFSTIVERFMEKKK